MMSQPIVSNIHPQSPVMYTPPIRHGIDTMLFVDWYDLYKSSRRKGKLYDPFKQAKTLKQFIIPFGRDYQCEAITYTDDPEGNKAYQQAGYRTISLNGDRNRKLHKLIHNLQETVNNVRPKRLIIVSTDPAFYHLLKQVASVGITEPVVWAPSDEVDSLLTDPDFNFIRLEEMLPETKPQKVAILVDYENIYFGLNGIKLKPSTVKILERIREQATNLGNISSFVGYADWDTMKTGSENPQRVFAKQGVQPIYLIGQNGKNTADMKIADDIRNLLEQDDTIDKFVLVTGDRDYLPSVEAIKSRGKEVHLISLKSSLSRQLREAVHKVYYLEEMLQPMGNLPLVTTFKSNGRPTEQGAEFAVQIVVLLHRKHWKHTYANRIAEELGSEMIDEIPTAKELGIITDQQGRLYPNDKHPLVKIAQKFMNWTPWRIQETTRRNSRFKNVSTGKLLKQMKHDRQFPELCVQQKLEELEAWLELLAKAGIIVKTVRMHKDNSNHITNYWSLPQQGYKPEPNTPSKPIIEGSTQHLKKTRSGIPTHLQKQPQQPQQGNSNRPKQNTSPESVTEEDIQQPSKMYSGIPAHLQKQLRINLLACDSFDTDDKLKAIFIDERVSPWQNRLPEAKSRTERVERMIDLLHNQYNQDGQNALVLLLQMLSERLDPRDACHHQLANLASEVAKLLCQALDVPITKPNIFQ